MRRILVSCAVVGALALPAAAIARAHGGGGRPGYVVVSKAVGNGGVNGSPVVTVVVQGFVLGRVSQEGDVQIVQLPSVSGRGAPQVTPGVSTKPFRWHGRGHTVLIGKEYTGSNFRFRAMGGLYRVVVRGTGVYLFAGGHGHVTVQGSSYQHPDGTYSVNGSRPRSLPKRPLTRKIGGR
jgi:hypothetical protein